MIKKDYLSNAMQNQEQQLKQKNIHCIFILCNEYNYALIYKT